MNEVFCSRNQSARTPHSPFHPCLAPQVLALAGTVLVITGMYGRRSSSQVLLQVNRGHMMRQRGQVMQTLFGGWSTVTPEQFDGRCRCTGYRTYNPDQRVVCACTGPPGGDNDDLWRKGPYKILSGCVFRPRLNSLAAHDFPRSAARTENRGCC